MPNRQLSSGIRAARSGDKRTARRLLGQVVRDEPENATAWWFLAQSVEDSAQKVTCLRHVVRLHPDHSEARQMLHDLGRRLPQQPRPATHPTPRPDLPSNERAWWWLLIVAAAVIMVGSSAAFLLIGSQRADMLPERTMSIGVPTCYRADATQINMTNQTPATVEVLRGPQNNAQPLLTLAPGESTTLEAVAGRPTRYEVRAEGFISTGATITVEDEGNTCDVVIREEQ